MKKIFALVLAMVLVATMFAGCSETSTAYESERDAVVEAVFADLAQIPGYDYLYYSTTDRTVYYLYTDSKIGGFSYSFFGPRIINGHNCEYVDGEIVEVFPTVKIEDATN